MDSEEVNKDEGDEGVERAGTPIYWEHVAVILVAASMIAILVHGIYSAGMKNAPHADSDLGCRRVSSLQRSSPYDEWQIVNNYIDCDDGESYVLASSTHG